MYDMKALYEAKSVEDAIRLLQEHRKRRLLPAAATFSSR